MQADLWILQSYFLGTVFNEQHVNFSALLHIGLHSIESTQSVRHFSANWPIIAERKIE